MRREAGRAVVRPRQPAIWIRLSVETVLSVSRRVRDRIVRVGRTRRRPTRYVIWRVARCLQPGPETGRYDVFSAFHTARTPQGLIFGTDPTVHLGEAVVRPSSARPSARPAQGGSVRYRGGVRSAPRRVPDRRRCAPPSSARPDLARRARSAERSSSVGPAHHGVGTRIPAGSEGWRQEL